ncbi:MAG: FliI/YscN family ATPase [Pseudomonadota bacterium]
MTDIRNLASILERTPLTYRLGRVKNLGTTSVDVAGLSDVASIGDHVEFVKHEDLTGEITQVSGESVRILIDGDFTNLKMNDVVRHIGEVKIYPDISWLGNVIDSHACTLDGGFLSQGGLGTGRNAKPPIAIERKPIGSRLSAGYAVMNTLLPLARGQRIGLFAGSGVGKSTLIAALASDLDVEVVVIALIGERGREVKHFVESVLGDKGLARSVVIAATSDQSAISRRRAAFTAMAVAEYFRDQGLHVLLLVDSISRMAEAHREITSASGEPNSMRGYPPSLTALLAGFAERAGPGTNLQGDITAIFTVLVAGSDMEEPVADTLRGLLDGHLVLSRDIAERGRFPAIDVLQSVSRCLPEVANDEENSLISRTRHFLSLYEESELMIRSGLYQAGSNTELDEAVRVFPKIDHFLSMRCDGITEAFDQLSEAIKPES